MKIKRISENGNKKYEEDLEKEEMYHENVEKTGNVERRKSTDDEGYHTVNTPREIKKYFKDKEIKKSRSEKDESFTVVDLINANSRHFEPSYLEDDILKSFDNIDYGDKDLNLKMKKYYIKKLSVLQDMPRIDNTLVSEGTRKENEQMSKLKRRFKRTSYDDSRRSSDDSSQEVLITRTSIQENRSFEVSSSRIITESGQTTTTIYEKGKCDHENPNNTVNIESNDKVNVPISSKSQNSVEISDESNLQKMNNTIDRNDKSETTSTPKKANTPKLIVEKSFDIISSSQDINLMPPTGASKTYEKEKILNAKENNSRDMNSKPQVNDCKHVHDETYDVLTVTTDIPSKVKDLNGKTSTDADSKSNLKSIYLEPVNKEASDEQTNESFDILTEAEAMNLIEAKTKAKPVENKKRTSLEITSSTNQPTGAILTSSLKLKSSFDDIPVKEQPINTRTDTKKPTTSNEKFKQLEIKVDAEELIADEDFDILPSPQKPISSKTEIIDDKEEEFILVSPQVIRKKKRSKKESIKSPKVLSWSDLNIIDDESPLHVENPNDYITRKDMKKLLDEYDEENNRKTELLVREMREANESIVRHFEEIISNTCTEIKSSIKDRQDSQLSLIKNVILLQNQVIHDNVEIKEMVQNCACAKPRKHVTFSPDVDGGPLVDSFEFDNSSKESKLNQKVKQLISKVMPNSEYMRQKERMKEQLYKEEQQKNKVVCVVEKNKAIRIDVMEDIAEVPELEVSTNETDDSKQKQKAESVKVIPYYERMKRRVTDDDLDNNIWQQANARQLENKEDNTYFIDLLDKNNDDENDSFRTSGLNKTRNSVDIIRGNIGINGIKEVNGLEKKMSPMIERKSNEEVINVQESISNNLSNANTVATNLTNMIEDNMNDLGKKHSKMESVIKHKDEKEVGVSKNTYQKERKPSKTKNDKEEERKTNRQEDMTNSRKRGK